MNDPRFRDDLPTTSLNLVPDDLFERRLRITDVDQMDRLGRWFYSLWLRQRFSRDHADHEAWMSAIASERDRRRSVLAAGGNPDDPVPHADAGPSDNMTTYDVINTAMVAFMLGSMITFVLGLLLVTVLGA